MRAAGDAPPPATGCAQAQEGMNMATKIGTVAALWRAVGWRAAALTVSRRAIGDARTVAARWRGRPIGLRPLDSDLFAAAQVFGAEEYALPAEVDERLDAACEAAAAAGETPVVVDAGANVGFAALWFRERHPRAHVIAIEPDPGCCARLRAHLEGVAGVEIIQAALWEHDRGVRFATDGPSWARRVDDGLEAAPTPSVTLGDVLARVPRARPLVLKLDVEGAEREIARTGADLVSAFDVVIVEPHDFLAPGSASLAPLLAALAAEPRDTLIRGENLVFYRSAMMA
jgi:FkbM family methyltransferase